MEKIEVTFADIVKSRKIIPYVGKSIEVNRFISLGLQSVFIQEYCNMLLDITVPRENRIVNAELELKMRIVDFQTNIALSEEFSLDGLLESGVYKQIIESIDNYDEFRELLDTSVEFVLGDYSLEKSVGGAIDNLIQKLGNALDTISKLDFSEGEMAKLTSAILNTQKEFDDKWGTDKPNYHGVAPGQLGLDSAEVITETTVETTVEVVEELPKKKTRKPRTPKPKE